MDSIKTFIDELSQQVVSEEATNLYAGNSKESKIRRANLEKYLTHMYTLQPEVLLLGEAPGYKGCKLTGIPFTSEEIVATNPFFQSQEYDFVNAKDALEKEKSANIVWKELDKYNQKPLIWNIFQFHPHTKDNLLTNRAPKKAELELGKTYLVKLLEIFKVKKILAIGRQAESQLKDLPYESIYVRHPSYGGKPYFVKGLAEEMI
ncbi:uracil-DNA glycosylase [Algivirga pacifica]|uniref:Uracil-DNA glycosylase n=1 Tax=Algivirga pacifica TaxID=1162670 RepID=A0ABP9DLP6_9BACT